ncbi:MAG: radical SAM protein [Archaeoglobus sp.]|nr:radical SAM protein [Archaeoglobus sp.]
MIEAKLWRDGESKIRCLLCWNRCRVAENSFGHCRARYNEKGTLKTLTYGNLSAIESRPMEIKPFFHFLPGSSSLTFSTYSCNLDCPWCQNWHLSKRPPPEDFNPISPEKLIEMALKNGDRSTCASFNEPTLLFEYLLDLFPLARKNNLRNTIVSNGYMMPKALKMLIDAGLNAANFDIKGGDGVYARISKGGKSKYIWRNARFARKKDIHVEVVCLLSPPMYKNPELIDEVISNHLKYLDPEVPIHFTRYFPAYLTSDPPTSVKLLEEAVMKAKKEGIDYVYIGNVHHRFENTFCPECGVLLIRRNGFRLIENRLEGDRCFNCGRKIAIVVLQ